MEQKRISQEGLAVGTGGKISQNIIRGGNGQDQVFDLLAGGLSILTTFYI